MTATSRLVSTPRYRWLVLVCALICALAATASCNVCAQAVPDAPQLQGRALLAALRSGGYILYFRHASTDFGQSDEQMTDISECATQRNLTDKGRDEARAVGTAIRDIGLPVGDVLASPFCRTLETARLMFGRATATAAVRGGPVEAESSTRYAELRKLLSTPVAAGTNLVIVSHGNPYRSVVGGAYLAEGEAAVIQPRGAAGFRVVARVKPDEWQTLQIN